MIHRAILSDEVGFTLVEMLMVVAIIGILIAIAIPQFVTYRKKGHEAQAKSDLRNAAAAQEAYFADKDAYKSGPLTSGTPVGFNKSPAVTISASVGPNSFQLTASHANCSSTTWTFSSSTGAISGGPCP